MCDRSQFTIAMGAVFHSMFSLKISAKVLNCGQYSLTSFDSVRFPIFLSKKKRFYEFIFFPFDYSSLKVNV